MDAIDIWKSTDGGQTLTDISCGYHTGLIALAGARGQPRPRIPAWLLDEPARRKRRRHLRLEQRDQCAARHSGGDPQPADVQGRQPDDEHDRVLRRRHQRELRHRARTRSSSAARRTTARPSTSSPAAPRAPHSVASGRSGSAATGSTRASSRSRDSGSSWRARTARSSGRRRARKARTSPVAGGWGGDRLSFIFPYEIDKFACPTPTCDHMIAGSYRVWESIDGATAGTRTVPT